MPQPRITTQIKNDLKQLGKDVNVIWSAGRQPAEDVVTVLTLGGYAQRGARRAYIRAAAPVVRLEQRLAALEATAARVDARLSSAPGAPPPALGRPRLEVQTRPTVDGRVQVDVRGSVPPDAQLLFVQNGVERPARIVEAGPEFLRGDQPMRDLDEGAVDVWLAHDGRRDLLTTLDVRGS